jgi:hypothetical protein
VRCFGRGLATFGFLHATDLVAKLFVSRKAAAAERKAPAGSQPTPFESLKAKCRAPDKTVRFHTSSRGKGPVGDQT